MGTPKRTNVLLYPQDHDAIRTIKEAHGVSSDSDAMRLALRLVARSRVVLAPKEPDLTHPVTAG